MSKISLEPNASGAGTFSIVSPDSNTNRTLNLPDEDGNLVSDGGVLFVDSANNRVGIGTSSPASKVDADGTIRAVNQINPSSGTGLEIAYNTDADIGQILSYDRGGNNWKPLELRSEDIRFQTSGSDIARFDSSRNLLIGATSKKSGGRGLFISGRTSANGSVVDLQANDNPLSGRDFIRFHNRDGDLIGEINNGGSSVSYNTSSDYRLKENVTDLSDGITRLKNLPVHRFNFIADPDKTVDGFLAHEVQPYVPEAVTGEKDGVIQIGDITDTNGKIVEEGVAKPDELEEGQTWTQTGEQIAYQGIDQAKLVPLLTAALQEAVEKIEQQQTQINDLISRITTLETN